jgi:hypothetical protein
MLRVGGTVQHGVGDFSKRMKKFADVFREATGEPMLQAGTLNVKMDREIPFHEHFQILELVGDEWGWVGPVRFEICRIDSMWAFRIKGGHVDLRVAEICSRHIPKGINDRVELEFFGEIWKR